MTVFSCFVCNFSTDKCSLYERHCNTNKHLKKKDPNKKNAALGRFLCVCGRRYVHQSSLIGHKKKCETYLKEESLKIANSTTMIKDGDNFDIRKPVSAEVVLELMKQNSDMKVMLEEQNNELKERFLEQMKDQQTQLMDAINDGKIGNSYTQHNTTNKFNLQFFLNTTCKNAMNLQDFVDNLDIQVKDIEYVGNHGYVEGITHIIMDRLQALDVTERPIHCTDLKRETMYIKHKDEWLKDMDDQKIKRLIYVVADINYKKVPDWQWRHPEFMNSGHPDFEVYLKMMDGVLGGIKDSKLDDKIVKNIAKLTAIDRKQYAVMQK